MSCYCGASHTSLQAAWACYQEAAQAPTAPPASGDIQTVAKTGTSQTDSAGHRAGIYVVEAGGRYRIGCSSDPERRARELRGTLLDWVAIPFGYDLVESRVRERYAARRLHGEWLALSAGDLAAFGRVVREAVRDVRRVHPLALRRRPPGRPALTPEERRERARARKRRWRDCRRARLGPALGAR